MLSESVGWGWRLDLCRAKLLNFDEHMSVSPHHPRRLPAKDLMAPSALTARRRCLCAAAVEPAAPHAVSPAEAAAAVRAMLSAAGLPADPAADALLERSLALQADLRAAQGRLTHLEQVWVSASIARCPSCGMFGLWC